MKIFYNFVIIYIVMFLIDKYLLKRFRTFKINEYDLMKKLCNLKRSSNANKSIKLICSLINAFIMSIVIIFNLYSNWSFYITFPLSFILLLLLIYSFYKIFGNILKGKENEKRY